MTDNTTTELKAAAKAFRQRAIGLRSNSFLILGLIFLLLVGGAFVFVFASQLTLSDFAPKQDYNKKISDLVGKRSALFETVTREQSDYDETVQRRADTLGPAYDLYIQTVVHAGGVQLSNSQVSANINIEDDNIADAQSLLRKNLPVCAVPCVIAFARIGKMRTVYEVSGEALGRLKSELAAFKPPQVAPIPEQSAALQKDRNELNNVDNAVSELKRAQNQAETSELVGAAQAQPQQAKSEPTPLAQIIQTNVTRFGTILMIIFLVTILTPLYRYNIRLATYYDARADVLDLCTTEIRKVGFVDLAAALTPTFDFGKGPETPLEQVLQLVRQLYGKKESGEGPG